MAFVISCASVTACWIFARRLAPATEVVTAPASSMSMPITTISSTSVKPLLSFKRFIVIPPRPAMC